MNATKTAATKWTYRQLTTRMGAAGWYSLGSGVYRHVAQNRTIQLFSFDAVARRELWHRYAEARAVPKAEDFR